MIKAAGDTADDLDGLDAMLHAQRANQDEPRRLGFADDEAEASAVASALLQKTAALRGGERRASS